MLLGAMNDPQKDILEEIKLFGEMGFDFVELAVEAPGGKPEKLLEKKKEIEDLLNSYNFGVLAHFPWYFHLASHYEKIRDAYLAETKKALEAVAEFKAKSVTLHSEFLPSLFRSNRKLLVAQVRESLGMLREKAEEKGITLLLENGFEDAEGFSEFLPKGVGITLDLGHANLSKDGIEGYLRKFKNRISHVHASDNFGKEDNHLPIGAGGIKWKEVLEKLKRFYDGTITLEIHAEDRDYLALSRDKIEILWYGEKKFRENKEYLFPK